MSEKPKRESLFSLFMPCIYYTYVRECIYSLFFGIFIMTRSFYVVVVKLTDRRVGTSTVDRWKIFLGLFEKLNWVCWNLRVKGWFFCTYREIWFLDSFMMNVWINQFCFSVRGKLKRGSKNFLFYLILFTKHSV